MGFAFCRFERDEDCNKTGSQEWHLTLPDVNTVINVPSLWKHYVVDHFVQPTDEERRVILSTDPKLAFGNFIQTRGPSPDYLPVLYVERLGPNEYSHEIGSSPDMEFVQKLESILGSVDTPPLQTKGVYR